MSEKCWECERGNVPLHNHHPVPRVRGGIKTIPLCEGCHSKAHHMDNNMNTSALIREGLKKTKENGTKLGRPKYGYSFGREHTPNPEEMEVVLRVKKLREDKVVFREIVEILREEGYKTRKGTDFSIPQLHRIVTYNYPDIFGARDKQDEEEGDNGSR